MCKTTLAAVLFLTLFLPAPITAQAAPNGRPFQNLQEQLDDVQVSVQGLTKQLEEYRAEAEARIALTEGQIVQLENQLDAEKAARLIAEGQLLALIDQEKAERQAADETMLADLGNVSLPESLSALADFVFVEYDSINGLAGPHVIFEGANFHVRSGYGATNDWGSLSGLGNLIIGYNEAREYATKDILDDTLGILAWNCMPLQDPWNFDSDSGPGMAVPGCPGSDTTVQQSRRAGSHNLIVGEYHNFNSYGGIIGGIFNATDEHAVGASVLGGNFNLATHPLAMIVGGTGNRAHAHASTILSGRLNKTVTFGYGRSSKPIPPWPIDPWGATEAWSSIVAGRSNLVASMEGAVVGGVNNSVKYTNTSVIVGGQGNYISTIGGSSIGDDVVILGGRHITATDSAQVQPLDASMEALTVALVSGQQGCSDGTRQFLDIASNIPGIGDLFGWLGSGCDVW